MRENSLLLILWFIPVLWIEIALYEELKRVFLLTNLWKFSKSTPWIIIALILTSAIIALAHWSQGSYGIVTIALKSMVACIHFYKYKRLLPLVIAHALYDGIQVAMLLISYPHLLKKH
ncbi:MAG: CPBP family intramembrane metalloprotease [Bacteroidales bacterium]|nr:CPBP family intramembrane metalloprotease [Bacteroidales bacterium]MCF8391104.1 CPBP family intramembrane metalloprotease [Bacteroidales bacterium]